MRPNTISSARPPATNLIQKPNKNWFFSHKRCEALRMNADFLCIQSQRKNFDPCAREFKRQFQQFNFYPSFLTRTNNPYSTGVFR